MHFKNQLHHFERLRSHRDLYFLEFVLFIQDSLKQAHHFQKTDSIICKEYG